MSRARRRPTTVAAIAIVIVVGAVLGIAAAARHESSPVVRPVATTEGRTGTLANPFLTGRTLVIPHGGGDGLFPENTMIAYTSTVAMGADVVDVDLRLSSDGQLVAIHDPTVDRTTGASGSVASMTAHDLGLLDAGWYFSPSGDDDAHPFRGQGVGVPTLESILSAFPTSLLSLDLKDESMAMIEPLCTMLSSHGRFDDVFVGSNNDAQILQFREECPNVRTSATMVDVYAARDARAANDPNFVPAVTVDQPPFRIDGRQLVDVESLAWAHEHGIAILPWVVNDEADMQYLIDIGVDGIYTSYPDRLLRLLGRASAVE